MMYAMVYGISVDSSRVRTYWIIVAAEPFKKYL